jgi:hypothetical protein
MNGLDSHYCSEEAKAIRLDRSSLIHGGNVLEDYFLIWDMSTTSEAWGLAFERYYEVPFIRILLRSTEQEILEIMNIAVSAKELWTWKGEDKAERRKERPPETCKETTLLGRLVRK